MILHQIWILMIQVHLDICISNYMYLTENSQVKCHI